MSLFYVLRLKGVVLDLRVRPLGIYTGIWLSLEGYMRSGSECSVQ
jgi:hypothetical protein